MPMIPGMIHTLQSVSSEPARNQKQAATEEGKSAFFQVLSQMLASSEQEQSISAKEEPLSPEALLNMFKHSEELVHSFSEELHQLFEQSSTFSWSNELGELFQQLPLELQDIAGQFQQNDTQEVLDHIMSAFAASATEGSHNVTSQQHVSEVLAGWLAVVNQMEANGQNQIPADEPLSKAVDSLAAALMHKDTEAVQSKQVVEQLRQSLHANTAGKTPSLEQLLSVLRSLEGSNVSPFPSLQQANISRAQRIEQLLLSSGSSQMRGQTFSSLPYAKEQTDYLQQLLQRDGQTKDPSYSPFNNTSSNSWQRTDGTLTNVQQMAVHVGEQKSEHARGQEFVRQFQNVLGKSQLQTLKNGTQELSMKLHPEHLGRVDVKLVQQNGQMTAQLLTTTKAAKDMIEQSLQQLRQAFVQQNISVDRIDISQQQLSYLQQESEEKHHEQRERSRKDSHEQNQPEEDHDAFQDMLDELTFHEQV
ncbi:hook-length control protein FliK [Alteribacillus persepolensis]|uniref:Hook-length control protein FliK n=1 Tax=Alteribacillus persepolensis TaxID=568899 RepID=A0A1G7YN89_9BACI|nr:flagellar hook-length control protein FliK [Alteribacillus persepolensis]SDG98003.1 hook-length control protein FliK [Alteribacillus persepolensis]